MPSPGKIVHLREPAGPGIRIDSGVYEGWTVPMEYDPLLAKLAVWAGDAKVTRFEVWRDLHYTTPQGGTYAGRGNALKIPPDSVFVLGDCSRESIDSRFYGPVPLHNLRGLPFLVWSPGSRRRILH